MSEFTVQRFRGGFAIVWRDADDTRRRQKLTPSDRQSAEAEARKVWELAADGEWTVGRAVEHYLDVGAERGMISIQRRRDAWTAPKSFWQNVDPALIDEKIARKYCDIRGVAPATVRLELSMIKTALRKAPKGKIQSIPELWFPPLPEPAMRHLSRSDFHRFLSFVIAPHARLFMILGVMTMARPSTILALKWSQIDLARRLITLNPTNRIQTRKRRPVVPIGNILFRELELARAMRSTEFVIERGGKGIRNIKKAFQAASKRSGIKATPYSLRHTGAVWAAEQGASMSKISQMMGHDSVTTTEKYYARCSPDYLHDVSNNIEEAFNEGVQSEL